MLKKMISAILFVMLASTFCLASETKNPLVIMETNKGTVKMELYPEKAPVSVKNFLDYVASGFYADTIFHRVIAGFMVQGGGFTTEFKQKPVNAAIKNEADNGLKNDRGTLAMARTMMVDSATAQFYINVVNNDFLNHRDKSPQGYGYTVFGKVVDGMAVVDRIATARTSTQRGFSDVPVEQIVIKSIKLQP